MTADSRSKKDCGDLSWPRVVLGEVASIERQAVAPEDVHRYQFYVGLENVTSSGGFKRVTTAGEAALKSNKFAFDDSHVLYGKLRPYLAKIAAPTFAGICSTDILPIKPSARLNRRYLLHYLRIPKMVAYAASNAVGINLPRLSPKVLESFEIPLPSIEEQRQIAAVLDAADALRAKRRLVLSKLDTLTRALFVDMFGDPVHNRRGWHMAPLTELGNLDRGVSKHRPRNDPVLLGGRWPLIQTGDVSTSGGYIRDFETTYSDAGLEQSKIWPSGTLCITIAANIAKTGILTFDACFPDSVVGFTAEREGASEFVRAVLDHLQPILEQQAPESAQKNINLKVLRGLQVPIPPESLMAEYARRVVEVTRQKTRTSQHLEQMDMLFVSLQQRAFRGEL